MSQTLLMFLIINQQITYKSRDYNQSVCASNTTDDAAPAPEIFVKFVCPLKTLSCIYLR